MKVPSVLVTLVAMWLHATIPPALAESVVVFNEIHYHPQPHSPIPEFIELLNQNATDIDLSGWSLQGAVRFTFPPRTILRAASTLLISDHPESLQLTLPNTPILGPYEGQLSNGGETLQLVSANLRMMDEVSFQDEHPWPAGADGTGFTLTKRAPNLDSQSPQSWQLSSRQGGSPGQLEFPILPPSQTLESKSSLLAFYPFDSGPQDATKNHRDGKPSPSGLTLTTNQAGYEGECYRFDGHGFIDVPLSLSPSVVPQLTMGAWIRIAKLSSPARNEIISTDNGGYDRALTIDTRSGLTDPGVSRYAAFAGSSTGVLPGAAAKNNDGWIFIAATFDSLFGRTTLYVQTNVYSTTSTHGPAAAFTRIGAHPLGIEFFNGWIDNVFLFKRILSRDEIETIRLGGAEGVREIAYRPTPPTDDPRLPLLALLPLDHSASDLSGRGFHGVTNGSVQFLSPTHGFENGSAFFSGGGITIPLNLSPNLRPQITLGAWVKPARIATNNTRHPILATGTRTFDRGISIDSRSGERESSIPRYVAMGGDGIGMIPAGPPPASTQDQWTFCAAIYNTTLGTTTFVVNDQVTNAEASQFSDVANLYIGRNASGSSTFQGWIDNVFVFNRALTLTELQSIRRGGTQAILALNDIPELPTSHPRPSTPCPDGLQINELSPARSNPFLIELVNLSTSPTPLPLSGFQLHIQSDSGTHSITLPPVSLPQHSVQAISVPPHLLPLLPEDLVYLTCENNGQIIDARHIADSHQSRLPSSTHNWTTLLPPSPDSPNPPSPPSPRIFFNEIHYHPPRSANASDSDPLRSQWIELWNDSAETINLSHYRLSGDVQFSFPPDTLAPPHSYLIIAKDPADFQSRWPNVPCLGPFVGSLKRGQSGHVQLESGEGWPIDVLNYSDSGRWPAAADGGGSTLELRNPNADRSSPETWAASLESHRSPWTHFSYQGVASQNPGYTIGNDQFQELVIGLLNAGEFLLDDVSVVETSSTPSTSLIQNGSFDLDTPGSIPAAWRIGGNHDALGQSRVIADPDNPSNRCLRVVATGATDYLHNHLETTLKSGSQSVKIIPGRTYTISFRAKWISGTPLLNTRLYFNFLQKTHALPIPPRNGTPGQINSTFTSNLGPTFDPLEHAPAVPSPSDSITIQSQIRDPDQVARAMLHYRFNDGPWQALPMTQDQDDLWKSVFPPQPAGTRIQFYASAIDSLGATSLFPSEGTNSCSMLRVETSPPPSTDVHRLLILMPEAETTLLYTPALRMSNQRRRATVIYDDREVFHNVGIRLKGSAFGRNHDTETGLNIEFNPERLFRGIHPSIALERNGGTAGREILAKYFFNQAGPEIGSLYDDITHVRMPRSSDDGLALIALSRNSEEFLQSQWNRGDEGSVWNMDLLYSPNGTTTGHPEAPKLNFPYNHDFGQPDIQYLGDDKEAYRWNFTLRNNRDSDHYAPLIALAQAFELKGAELDSATADRMDVEQWLRHFALLSLIGNSDVYLRYWNHNLRLYQRPSDGRILVLPWDLDSSFTLDINAPLWGTSNGAGTPVRWGRVIDLPGNSRRFQSHLFDLVTHKATPGRIAQWSSHYGLLTQQDFSPHADWLIQRRRFVLSQLSRLTNFFHLTTSNSIVATESPWPISGRAGIEIHHFLVNGQPVKTDWSGPTRSATNFVCHLPLSAGTHTYQLQAFNLHNEPLPQWSPSLTIAYNPPNTQSNTLHINEWMAANNSTFLDPSDQDYEDWIELWNESDQTIHLGGYALSDTPSSPRQFVIPQTGYAIPPRSFFLIWADGESHQNQPGRPDLHLPFKLSSDGETITLSDPSGRIVDSISFGVQIPDRSEGRYPDGHTTLVLFDTPTPGAPNHRATPPKSFTITSIQLQPDGSLSWVIPTEKGVRYEVLYSTALDPIRWVQTGITLLGNGELQTISSPSLTAPHSEKTRFYRVVAP